MGTQRTGIWLIGARGGVATTSILGLIALKKGLIGDTGLVSQLPLFEQLNLTGWDRFVVGGHDIREQSLVDSAQQLSQQSQAFDPQLVDSCRDELAEVNENIRNGTLINVGETIQGLATGNQRQGEKPWLAVERLRTDIAQFAQYHQLRTVIVVNVASTEPPVENSIIPNRWNELKSVLQSSESCPIGASSLYAIAALDIGFPYINFTPSIGSAPPAIAELAELRNTCHMGHDGKTGETLLKSVLAPMFAHRNLEVMSWVGHNIFGNLDGKVLDDPSNKASKVASKDRLLGKALGYNPQSLVSIEYIESLGDWKTAWDHIHFRGFLGTPMTMQFTWQGCDSILAAPLVLDLVRFADRAHRQGQSGLLTFLASFFKRPLGVDEHDFGRQFQMLQQWAQSTTAVQ